MTYSNRTRWWHLAILSLLLLLVTACGSGNANVTATPTQQPVNGFGTTQNHVHSLLALPNKVLLMATHYGIFRSEDDGASWEKVAAGPGQLMEGLMAYAMSISSLNQQRVYVLTLQAVPSPKGTIGLYTSADQGRTWKMAIAASALSEKGIYNMVAGNDTPDEVYIYLSDLGSLGLKVSLDDGQHFSTTGTLPFGNITNVLPVPGTPGLLIAYGTEGIARSSDGGIHWQVLKAVNDDITEMTTTGPHDPIYASGGQGIYVSKDEGKSFTLVNSAASYGALAVSPTQTQTLYGETGTAVYRSTDGGHTWNNLPNIHGTFRNLGKLAVDPLDPSQLYLSVSYPTEVYSFAQSKDAWSSLTPAA